MTLFPHFNPRHETRHAETISGSCSWSLDVQQHLHLHHRQAQVLFIQSLNQTGSQLAAELYGAVSWKAEMILRNTADSNSLLYAGGGTGLLAAFVECKTKFMLIQAVPLVVE